MVAVHFYLGNADPRPSLHPAPAPSMPTCPGRSTRRSFGLVLQEIGLAAWCFHRRRSSFASSNPSPRLVLRPQTPGHPFQEGFLHSPFLWRQRGGVVCAGDPPSPSPAPSPPAPPLAGEGRRVRSGVAGAAGIPVASQRPQLLSRWPLQTEVG